MAERLHPNQPMLRLTWEEDGASRSHRLAAGVDLLLGRDPACDLVFGHSTVSRRHLQLSWRGDRLFGRQLSPKSPTWLNDRLLMGEAPLTAGDRIQLAIVELRLEAEAAT